MSEQHKATPEEWATIEELGRDNFYAPSCILELRARVEALEATQHAHVDLSGVPESERQQMLDSLRTPARIELLPLEQDRPQVVTPDAPASSLVERVAEVFLTGTFNADDPVGARAAIREVAAWLVEKYSDTDECLESLIGVVVGELQAETEE
jgi:hypothetical protein